MQKSVDVLEREGGGVLSDDFTEVVEYLIFQDSRCGGSGPCREQRVLNSCCREWEREPTRVRTTAGKKIVRRPPETLMKGSFHMHCSSLRRL